MYETVRANNYEFPVPALTNEAVTQALMMQVDAARARADLEAADACGMPVVPLPTAVGGMATAQLCVQASMLTRF